MALEHGLDLTFLGKPFHEMSGSGLHVNFSFLDVTGHNVLLDATSADGLSELAHGCLAGLVEHHRAIAAVGAPTVNAYRRLRPASLNGYWANWGHDHRCAGNRVPTARNSATRIENRICDGSVNVHLAVAGVLQAARLGVVDGLACPEPLTTDGFEEINTDICAAENLSLALDDLEADPSFVAALGADLVANYVANKRAEWDRFIDAEGSYDPDGDITAWELHEYLPYH